MTEQEALGWIAKLFDQAPETLTAETPREKIKAWDSLGVLLLMGGLDSDFNIQLTDEEVQQLKRVSDILAVLAEKGVLDLPPTALSQTEFPTTESANAIHSA